MVVAAVAAIAIGAAMALLITRSVVGPIQQAVDAAETVAGGDLRLRLVTDGPRLHRLLRASGLWRRFPPLAEIPEILGSPEIPEFPDFPEKE